MLVVLFVLTPFLEGLKNGDLIESATVSLVLFSGVLAVGGRRPVLLTGLALVIPALLGRWLHYVRPDVAGPGAYLVPGSLFVLFIFLHLLRFILRATRVNSEVLCAGVAGYLNLGLVWMMFYMALSNLTPGAFAPSGTLDRPTALYFSFITLTTTGYGDITPVSSAARMLAMLEAIIGTFYVAILISRLVALHTSNPPSSSTSPPPSN